jgi:hypothetical protein
MSYVELTSEELAMLVGANDGYGVRVYVDRHFDKLRVDIFQASRGVVRPVLLPAPPDREGRRA